MKSIVVLTNGSTSVDLDPDAVRRAVTDAHQCGLWVHLPHPHGRSEINPDHVVAIHPLPEKARADH